MMPLTEIDLQKHIWSLQHQIQLRQAELKKLERSLATAIAQQAIGQAARPALTNQEQLAIEPIEVLGLTRRTANCLKVENIYYVGDLLRHTEQMLAARPNLGMVQIQEILGVMGVRGLRLAEPHRLS
jgi:DNA-directed RNA polymerase alpha subunit